MEDRLFYLRAYLDLLAADGLLAPEDPTCVLFARVDDDRKRLAIDDLGLMLVGIFEQAAALDVEPDLGALTERVRRLRDLLTRR